MFPALVENRPAEDPVRIWVPGCATGEEAYSIAICLTEFMNDRKLSIPFEIFATDISDPAIEKARAGIYSERRVVASLAAAIGAFFHQNGTRIPDCESHPRRLRFCLAQRGAGPAFLQAGPDQLLQRADLPWRRPATQGAVDSALRPEAGRLPGAGSLRKHRRALRVISSGDRHPQDLLHATGRGCARRSSQGRPPAPKTGRDPGQRASTGRLGPDDD